MLNFRQDQLQLIRRAIIDMQKHSLYMSNYESVLAVGDQILTQIEKELSDRQELTTDEAKE